MMIRCPAIREELATWRRATLEASWGTGYVAIDLYNATYSYYRSMLYQIPRTNKGISQAPWTFWFGVSSIR